MLGHWLLAGFGQWMALGGDWTAGREETRECFSGLSALCNGADLVTAPPTQPFSPQVLTRGSASWAVGTLHLSLVPALWVAVAPYSC